ncbi:MAG: hypothetical protein ACK4TO_08430 [Candidatus Nitrosotenuis sp.]
MDGRVVRLVQGKPSNIIIYSDDPLKNKSANSTEKKTSPFAISAASEADACVNPTKNRLGAIIAPHTDIASIKR